MRKILSLTIGISLLCSFKIFSQTHADSTWGVKFSNAMLVRYKPNINNLTGKGWEYSNSIILHGMEKIYTYTNNQAYLSYIQNYVDSYVNGSGAISGLGVSLDKIHPGLLLLFLYEKTGLLKYKTAATNLRNYILNGTTFPKNPEGGYWHKNKSEYSRVMMLDGIYMAHPFLAKYGVMFNDALAVNTATSQTLLLAKHAYQNSLHLALHAWHYDKSKPWANPITGLSSQAWSRGMGWYAMAIVDILKYLPSSHADYNAMHALLDSLVIGIKNTQDPLTGLWWQVMDKGGMSGNYHETSGSAMFVYVLKTASDNGWIDQSYLTVAQKGWTGVKSKISIYSDGMPRINDFAPAMSVQNNYTGYVSITSVDCPGSQHPHGYAAVLMASSVMEFPTFALSSATLSSTSSKRISCTKGDSLETNIMYADFTVYPNPSPDGAFNLQLNNFKTGVYNLRVINANGQIVISQMLDYNAKTTSSVSIQLPSGIMRGTYVMQLSGNNYHASRQILVE